MPDLAARFVATVFTVCGLATLLAVPASPLFSDPAGTQQQLMQVFSGGLLAVAAWVRPLQAPAIGTALLTKLLFVAACAITLDLSLWTPGLWSEVLQCALIAAAGVVLFHQSRREAAWEGVRPSRQQG